MKLLLESRAAVNTSDSVLHETPLMEAAGIGEPMPCLVTSGREARGQKAFLFDKCISLCEEILNLCSHCSGLVQIICAAAPVVKQPWTSPGQKRPGREMRRPCPTYFAIQVQWMLKNPMQATSGSPWPSAPRSFLCRPYIYIYIMALLRNYRFRWRGGGHRT